jgi:hypothetical protein
MAAAALPAPKTHIGLPAERGNDLPQTVIESALCCMLFCINVAGCTASTAELKIEIASVFIVKKNKDALKHPYPFLYYWVL